MKVKYVLFGVILIGVSVSGCTSLVFELDQEKGSEGTINIIIDTDSKNSAKVNIFIDNVRVGMDDLKSLAKKIKKAEKEKPTPQLYGTF